MKKININLTEENIRQLDRTSQKKGISRSELLRRLISDNYSLGSPFLDPEKLETTIEHPLDARGSNFFVGGHFFGRSFRAFSYIFSIDQQGDMWQVDSSFWNGNQDYDEQLGWWREKAEKLNLESVFYSDVRGVWSRERRDDFLPDSFQSIWLGGPKHMELARFLRRRVKQDTIHFEGDANDKRDLLIINKDLKSSAEEQGIQEKFWAASFACYAAYKSLKEGDHEKTD